MLTLTDDEIKHLEAIEERINKQGRMPWAFHDIKDQEVVRIPPQPNRFQRSFIGWAPEDIQFLLALVERAVGGESVEEVTSESKASPDGDDGGGKRAPRRSGGRGKATNG